MIKESFAAKNDTINLETAKSQKNPLFSTILEFKKFQEGNNQNENGNRRNTIKIDKQTEMKLVQTFKEKLEKEVTNKEIMDNMANNHLKKASS